MPHRIDRGPETLLSPGDGAMDTIDVESVRQVVPTRHVGIRPTIGLNDGDEPLSVVDLVGGDVGTDPWPDPFRKGLTGPSALPGGEEGGILVDGLVEEPLLHHVPVAVGALDEAFGASRKGQDEAQGRQDPVGQAGRPSAGTDPQVGWGKV